MQPENMKSFTGAIIAVLGFLLAAVPVANAQNTTQCTGTISDGSTINGRLVVPANATCDLLNVTVEGNVQVGTGARLFVFPFAGQTVTIDGNIVADGCKSVSLGFVEGTAGVISVEGNVNIQNCTDGVGYAGSITISGNFVCANNHPFCIAAGGVVQGNLTVESNNIAPFAGPAADVVGNQVGGNVDISGNIGTTSPSVFTNTIGGNLRCFDNSPAPHGTNNTVSGQKLGQCAGL
jgi:hypothetical protein